MERNTIHLNGDNIMLGVDTVISIKSNKIVTSTLHRDKNGEIYAVYPDNTKEFINEIYDYYLDTRDNRNILQLFIKK